MQKKYSQPAFREKCLPDLRGLAKKTAQPLTANAAPMGLERYLAKRISQQCMRRSGRLG